ncbi:MAG: DNA polymerase III subunit delta [Planctomycetes bacterium]|nr:DNA polymerase III subunit delta [Planctomycetota bacterium]
MDALPFLAAVAKAKLGRLYVLPGDEAFLKRHVTRALLAKALGDEGDRRSVSAYAGDKATFAEVFDDLDTMPFFDPKRVVLIENGDPFVTKYRTELEGRLAHLPETGLLILDVKTWASNTRLAKMVDSSATIVCKSPDSKELPRWCIDWCAKQHGKPITPDAARLLTELVEPEMGLLDQELLKLSIYVGARPRIEFADVDKIVGNNRMQNIWKILDAIGAANIKDALAMIDRLLDQGEEPIRIVGAISFQMRKLAIAARLSSQGVSLGAAIAQAGVPPFGQRAAETQIRHLGRRRLDRLFDWLVQLNLDLRGNSPLSARTLLERFLLRLARKNESIGIA